MMLDHLDHHPSLFGFGVETYILPHYLINESRYGDLARDENFLQLWNDLRVEFPFRWQNKGQPIELPSDWDDGPRSAAGVFDRIMREFARRERKERWCEKTPLYALHIERIARAFPAACFIHMIRDGRDCAISNHRRWGRHPANSIYRWKHVVNEGRRQGSLLGGRYMELGYEDLTRDPERHMKSVCSFSGVAFDERVLLASRVRDHMRGEKSRTIVRIHKKHAGYLSDSSLLSLEQIAGKRLATLGYSTRVPEGDLEPSPLRRLCWSAHDSFAVLIRRITNKLTGQKRMTWSLFFSRLRGTIRQVRISTPEQIARRKRR
jgi:hypothetical protein